MFFFGSLALCFLLGFVVGGEVKAVKMEPTNTLESEPLETTEDKPSEPIESIPEPTEEAQPKYTEMTVVATAYCPCMKCCGKTDGITATGTKATAGRTIAADPKVIPYGTEVILNGHIYIVEDCGGAIKGNKIDIFFDTHEEALEWGRQTVVIQVKRDVLL